MNEINNEEKKKQEALKQIIKDLHAGAAVEDLQKKFAKLIKDTSPEEIANMENALLHEGFPASEIQRLCDVHARVFEKALGKVKKVAKIPGHPVYTYVEENKMAKKIIKKLVKAAKKLSKPGIQDGDISAFKQNFDYFPMYDNRGEYKGVIEVSQEVSGIRALKGERRILT